jgi:hypothetical protein
MFQWVTDFQGKPKNVDKSISYEEPVGLKQDAAWGAIEILPFTITSVFFFAASRRRVRFSDFRVGTTVPARICLNRLA